MNRSTKLDPRSVAAQAIYCTIGQLDTVEVRIARESMLAALAWALDHDIVETHAAMAKLEADES